MAGLKTFEKEWRKVWNVFQVTFGVNRQEESVVEHTRIRGQFCEALVNLLIFEGNQMG